MQYEQALKDLLGTHWKDEETNEYWYINAVSADLSHPNTVNHLLAHPSNEKHELDVSKKVLVSPTKMKSWVRHWKAEGIDIQ
ncbi:hypothetical protein NEJ09_004052 [Salmonella enterica]|nr:hypothetical protein [Salmonella enterica]EBG5293753.1 hypothetical protein [Salmonella enterica subsp. enterica]EEJ7233432.1 hypothetical protein [Salmonella enterica subsp. salamae]HCM1854084.1 hypothetical protein [Salmonella enterica subsp. arizonae serovar 56:z4,z23:-]EBB1398648.1 hypothetical protein [Salmonella enterica]